MRITEKNRNRLLTLSACLPGFLISLSLVPYYFLLRVQDQTWSSGKAIQGMSCLIGVQLLVLWLTYKISPGILEAPWRKRAFALNMPIVAFMLVILATQYFSTRPQMMLRRMIGSSLPGSFHAQYVGGSGDEWGEYVVISFHCAPQELRKFISGLEYSDPSNLSSDDHWLRIIREQTAYRASTNSHWYSSHKYKLMSMKTFVWSDADTNAFFFLDHSHAN